MTTRYFRQFPVVEYKFGDNESTVNFQDLSVYIDALDQVKEYGTFYQNYHIQNGERPDHVSYRLYNTTDYYWTFWLLNDKLKERGWPIDNSQLYLRAKQYYPHLTFRVDGVAYDNALRINRPLSRSSTFKLGNYIWIQQNKQAGKIIRIDQEIGLLHVDMGTFTTRNPTVVDTNPNLSLGETGIASTKLVTIDEFSALKIMNGQNTPDQDWIPLEQYEVMNIVQAYHQYDAPHHYENTVTGHWVYPSYETESPHELDWSSVTTQQSVSYFQRLREVNDEQRAIKVLKQDVVGQIVSEFNTLLTRRQ